MEELLNKFIQKPNNADINFKLGKAYEDIGHTAGAVSFYLRAAEKSTSNHLTYESLIRAGICFDKQGKRTFSSKGLYQHALSVLPKRPEAYYHLSRFYEIENRSGHWQDCYMITSIALEFCSPYIQPLQTHVGYPGIYGLIFQKALSAWHCGLIDESKKIFKELSTNPNIDDIHRTAIINNLNYIK